MYTDPGVGEVKGCIPPLIHESPYLCLWYHKINLNALLFITYNIPPSLEFPGHQMHKSLSVQQFMFDTLI